MFNSIGWGEVVVLVLAALFIFGPERLPHLAKDAAAGLKKLRAAISGVREQMNDSLGDDLSELRNLDLRQYHPRTFIRNQLLGDDDEPFMHRGSASGSAGLIAGGEAVAARETAPSRDRGTPPPFDPDAT